MDMLSAEIYSMVGENDHESAEEKQAEMMPRESFRLAHHLWSEGFSIIPLCKDGKRPVRKWKRFQSERCSIADLIDWFLLNDFSPGIVTGELSGITIIDCDSPDAVDLWAAECQAPLMTQATKRGRHFAYPFRGERNTVRVNAVDGIDRRGEGGYVRAYPDSINWRKNQ